MSCTCKQDIEELLLASFREAKPEAKDHTVELQGYGLRFVGNTAELAGFMTYTATAGFSKKDGTLRTKSTKGSMVFSFCPFCGAKA